MSVMTYGKRGGLVVDRDSLHASPEYKRQIDALNTMKVNPMTLPQVVQDAVNGVNTALNDWVLSYAPEFCDELEVCKAGKRLSNRGTLSYISDAQSAMDSIRAELHRLTGIAEGYDGMVIRLHEVTARLEAANALLRDIASFRWFVTRAPFTTVEIQSHLQGAGDEL